MAACDVSVIGLGLMGSALAAALLKGGRRVAVWNRSTDKAAPLVAAGAEAPGTVAATVAASPIVLVCVADYAASKALLSAPEVAPSFAGRTVVELTTGSPDDAREGEARIRAAGAGYLDGAVMEYPGRIGAPNALILLSGPAPIFQRVAPVLAPLGGDIRHVGETIAAANVLDMAVLMRYLGMAMGTLQGSLICESEGIGADAYVEVMTDKLSRSLAKTIAAGTFAKTGGPLRVWAYGFDRIREQARKRGISQELPDLIARLMRQAIAAGHGDEDIAALVKVMGRRA